MICIRCEAWEMLRRDCLARFPEEACGLLVGRIGEGDVFIEQSHNTANLAENRQTAFLIDPAHHLSLQRQVRDAGEGQIILGCYHSHPHGEPVPSAKDHAACKEYAIWLIAALSGHDELICRGYRCMAETGMLHNETIKISG